MTNPYQPPGQPGTDPLADSGDEIALDGRVELNDIARLIRTPLIIPLLRVAACVTLIPFAGLAIGVMLFGRSKTESAGVMLLMVVVLGAIAVVADRHASRARRAKRLVAKHPGLTGPLRGKLDPSGITFFHETDAEFQRITWSAFPEVAVVDQGIRLDWRNDDNAFIAIPAHCIDGFDTTTIRERLDRFRTESRDPPLFQSIPDWSKRPEGTIAFESCVPIFATPDSSRLSLWALIGGGLIGALIVCFALLEMGRDWLLVVVISILVSVGIYLYEKIGSGGSGRALSWRLWGWLSAHGCSAHLPGNRYSFAWRDSESIDIESTHVLLTFPGGSQFYLTPTDLIDGDWSQVQDWIAAARDSHSDD